MFKCNCGYVFEARTDCNGKKGVKEEFNTFNGKARFTCGVSMTGEVTSAVYYTADEGFKSLSEDFKTEEEVSKFMRSRRATYAVVGQASYIAKVNMDIATKEAKIELYIPVQDVTISGGGCGVAYYKVSREHGLHLFKMSEKGYDILYKTVKKQVEAFDLSSKQAYYLSRM